MASGPNHTRLKNGEWQKAGSISISNDSAFFGDRAVPLASIRSIETRSFSFPKNAGLVAATGSRCYCRDGNLHSLFVIPEKLI